MMKLNTKVIWLASSLIDNMQQTIHEGVITKIGFTSGSTATIYVNHAHKAEDQLYAAFIWPDLPETRILLEDILALAAKHKAESGAMLSRQYELLNELTRKRLK
jgi:hypothetical protein